MCQIGPEKADRHTQRTAYGAGNSVFTKRHDDNPGLLDSIFTGDGTWVRHFVPEIKGENMEWKELASPRKKFINVPSAKKILLSSSGI